MNVQSKLVRLARAATLVFMLMPWTAQAALVISGPDSVLPGGTILLNIELDAALFAEIDTLMLTITSNNTGAVGVSAVAGPLLSGGSFLANAAGGSATMAFLLTLEALGPGGLASWTFEIDPLVGSPQPLEFQAILETFNLDDDLTAELVSNVKSVAVVPLPPAFVLLAVPLAIVARRSRRARTGKPSLAVLPTQ